MGKPSRSLALTAAIGFALLGATLYSSNAAQAVVPNAARDATAATASADSSYIITFVEAGLINYEGGISGLARTAPDAAVGKRLDRTTSAAHSYEAFLEAQRQSHLAAIEGTLGHALDVTHSYGITFNGIAASLTAAEAARIKTLPGVESVNPAGVYHLDTYRGPTFIDADKVWSGTSTPSGIGNRGMGVKVGIIDSGANSNHPSFANDASCGFSAANPKLIAVDCSSSSGGICNGSNPQAASGNGHGVHTAGTVAGNTIDNTAVSAPSLLDGMTMSGVAPCATVYSYLVCGSSSCAGSWVAAGIQNAIANGVDVINFSISGGTSPWNDNDRTFLDAVGNGTFVAASAGNNTTADPTVVGRVNHRGPWVMSVAASTQDKIVGPGISLTGPGTPPAATQNVALNPGSLTPASSTPEWADKPVKTYAANVEGCTASGGFPAGTFNGAVAVVRRGTCPFTEKITNAYNAGAQMVIIGNNQPGSINMDTAGAASVPAYSTSQVGGDALIAFVDANASNSTGDVAPIVDGVRQGDVLADFSYRGPTPGNLADLTKPDISGPGVDIYAATDPASGQYEFMSGTSMSGPHVAGAGALMKAVHPAWSPMEIRSALMMTAKRDGYREDGTTPWNIDDVGSGRVNVADAAMAGLTMNETKARFLSANPSGGSINIKELNLPAVRNMACNTSCTWTRTVKSQLAATGTWSVSSTTDPRFMISASPSSFTLAPGAEQAITFTAWPTVDITGSGIAFGYVDLTEANGLSPQLHLTAAIKGNKATSLYTVGGTIDGLTGSGLTLNVNGGNDFAVAADGAYTFPGGLPVGMSYEVTVGAQPVGQLCAVANNIGAIAGANVTNVDVSCVAAGTDWTVTPSVGSGDGSIDPSVPQVVSHGDTPSFELTADTGFQIDSVDGTCGGSLAGNVYTTAAVAADCTVIANFVEVVVGGDPVISVTPTALTATQDQGTTTTQTMAIANTGGSDLTWTVAEAARGVATGPVQRQSPRVNASPAPYARDYAAAPMADVITDGGFEQDSSAWSIFSENFGSVRCSVGDCGVGGGTGPHGGSYWLWFGGIDEPETGYARQNVTLPAGTASLSFWLEVPSTSGLAGDFLAVSIDGTEVWRVTADAASAYANYTKVTVDVSAFADDGTHQLSFDSEVLGLIPDGVTSFFVDDVELDSQAGGGTGCSVPTDLAWASVNPISGTTAAGASSDVTVTFDSTGMAQGSYSGLLCIANNDPANALVEVPVSMTVATVVGGDPVIAVTPTAVSGTAIEGASTTAPLTIANIGGGSLAWSIDTATTALPITVAEVFGGQMAGSELLSSGSGRTLARGGSDLVLANVQMSQTGSTVITPANSVACPTPPNSALRRFYFSEHPGATGTIDSVSFGLQETASNQTLSIKLYTIAHSVAMDTIPATSSLTLIGSATKAITVADEGTLVTVPISGFVDDIVGKDLVVEITGTTDAFYIGATDVSETHPGFLVAAACGAATPMPIADLGPDFGSTYPIIVVNTVEGGGGGDDSCDNPATIPWLSVTPASGSTAGGASSTVSVGLNAAGLAVGNYSANLCVTSNDAANPLVRVPVSFTVTSSAPVFPAPYCAVTFPTGVEPISRVVLGGIDNPSSPTGGLALENFLSVTGTLSLGGTYPMQVEGNTDGAFTNKVMAFIDWNQNGTFEASEGFALSDLVGSTGTDGKQATGNIVVPANALLGTTRMRVVKKFNTVPEPCNTAGYGQAEDYTIVINDDVITPPSATVNPVPGFDFTVEQGSTGNDTLVIGNVGGSNLNWSILEREAARLNLPMNPPSYKTAAAARHASKLLSDTTFESGSLTSAREMGLNRFGGAFVLGGMDISQMADNTPGDEGVSCGTTGVSTADNSWWRRFYFNEHPAVGASANISSVTISTGSIAVPGGLPTTINLYTLAHSTAVDTIPTESLVLIGTTTTTVSGALASVTIPVTGTVTDTVGMDLVVEWYTEGTDTAQFFPGANATAETHPSFISSAACSISTPTATSGIGFPDFHLTMVVTLDSEDVPPPAGCENPSDVPWLSTNPTSGSVIPGGSSNVVVTVNAGTMAAGLYEAELCVSSNDPLQPLITVPVVLEVTPGVVPPCSAADTIFCNGFEEAAPADPDVVTGVIDQALVKTDDGSTFDFVTGQFGGYSAARIDDVNLYFLTSSAQAGPGIYSYWYGDAQTDFTGLIGGVVSTGTTLAVLQSGAVIGPSSPVSAGSIILSDWLTGVDGYLGIAFVNEATNMVNYGYIHITTTAGDGYPAQVLEYAYNKAGNAITIP